MYYIFSNLLWVVQRRKVSSDWSGSSWKARSLESSGPKDTFQIPRPLLVLTIRLSHPSSSVTFQFIRRPGTWLAAAFLPPCLPCFWVISRSMWHLSPILGFLVSFFKIILFISLFMTVLNLHCCTSFSLVVTRRGYSLVWCTASDCGGLPCCRAWALGRVGFSSCCKQAL